MTSEHDEAIAIAMKRLVRRVVKGQVIPIISSSARIEEIFRADPELSKMMFDIPQHYDEFRTFDQKLTKKWAASPSVSYPLSDDHNLARVAQYKQVDSSASELRDDYLQFIIDRLLTLAESNENYKLEEEYLNVISAYRKMVVTRMPLFGEVVSQLGYPQYMQGDADPLRLLARLPLQIYITTSYSNFLETALEKEDKIPHTQLCFCKRELIKDPQHLPDRDFDPTVKEPAVVHLFGLEDYPETLVLSEDDHIDFLMNAVAMKTDDNLYPSYLRNAFADRGTCLMLLGYNPGDWEFRTIFRFLSMVRKNIIGDIDEASIAIQFWPNLGSEDNARRSLNNLKKYFQKVKFDIMFEETPKFVGRLYEECKPLLEN